MTAIHSKFWSNAILGTSNLINEFSSFFFNNKILYSILFPADPLYIVTPHVFGSTYVHDLTPGFDKLSACAISIKQIFLGYSQIQQGYGVIPFQHIAFKSLNVTNVTYFEDSPYFTS